MSPHSATRGLAGWILRGATTRDRGDGETIRFCARRESGGPRRSELYMSRSTQSRTRQRVLLLDASGALSALPGESALPGVSASIPARVVAGEHRLAVAFQGARAGGDPARAAQRVEQPLRETARWRVCGLRFRA
jgi:hypothetical protein